MINTLVSSFKLKNELKHQKIQLPQRISYSRHSISIDANALRLGANPSLLIINITDCLCSNTL